MVSILIRSSLSKRHASRCHPSFARFDILVQSIVSSAKKKRGLHLFWCSSPEWPLALQRRLTQVFFGNYRLGQLLLQANVHTYKNSPSFCQYAWRTVEQCGRYPLWQSWFSAAIALMDARRAKLESIIIIAAESLGVPWHISQYCANTLTLLRHHRVYI